MKRTLRPRSRQSRMTANTRSARSDGSAAVISSRIRSCGSWARARARSSIRSIGSGRSSTSSRRSSRSPIDVRFVRTASTDVPVKRRFWATERSGTSAGSWNTGESPSRAACRGRARANRPSRDRDGARVGPNDARERLDEGALPRAVGAEQRVHLPGRDGRGRRSEARRPPRTASRSRGPREAVSRSPLMASVVTRRRGRMPAPSARRSGAATAPCTPRTA